MTYCLKCKNTKNIISYYPINNEKNKLERVTFVQKFMVIKQY